MASHLNVPTLSGEPRPKFALLQSPRSWSLTSTRQTMMTKANHEPWVREFLESELAQFETLTGVTHIAEHVITMKDDRTIKQESESEESGHATHH
ncbi:hypothetical protein ACLKA6_016361 [Drosophila palustris]